MLGETVPRLRRLRRTENIRRMVRETDLRPDDLILPLFVGAHPDLDLPLSAIPGSRILSGGPLVEEAKRVRDLGIPALLLFPIVGPEDKDESGGSACREDGAVQEATRLLNKYVPELLLITDLCLCEYTSHSHCGVLKNGEIDNDLTLEVICRAAVSQAGAGADVIAPSGMMDGCVGALRGALDHAGFSTVMTMPYSAKFASRLYGPFKAATNSAPGESKHATHQLDVANSRQALEKIRLDVEQGADIVIVKPDLTSLDIIASARERFAVPIAGYNVSGIYNLVCASTADNPVERFCLMMEILTCVRRAGADLIITYFAKEAARFLGQRQ
jgi:porphobilinogen synthase